jgi:protein SCO1/2
MYSSWLKYIFVLIFCASSSVLMAIAAAAVDGAAKTGGMSPDLIDQHGKRVNLSRFLGKPTVVHFGFTHCPVICPTTLYEISDHLATLGPLASKVNFVFVTVDPERDTAGVLKSYISSFDERIIGITGTVAAIDGLTNHFGATYTKRPAGDTYYMDHVVYGYLKDHRWEGAGTLYLGSGAKKARVQERLKKMIADAARR